MFGPVRTRSDPFGCTKKNFRIYENSLKEISEEGFRYKPFHDNSQLCLAGEDRESVKEYLTKDGKSIFKPESAESIFAEDDLV